MSDYIKRKEFISKFGEWYVEEVAKDKDINDCFIGTLKSLIEKLPSADVVEREKLLDELIAYHNSVETGRDKIIKCIEIVNNMSSDDGERNENE